MPTNSEANMEGNLETKIKTYNEKSFQHSQNWKKIRALVNYSKTIDDFEEWEALEFIIRHFNKCYLDGPQEAFLDYILMKYNIHYDQWCYKTHWVERQFLKKREKETGQLELPFLDLEEKRHEAWKKMPIYSKLERHKLIQEEAM
jgi:hypothetical protein